MKKIKLAIIGAVAAIAGLAMASAPAMAKASCPSGTLRGEGTEVDSIAQCNLPPEDESGTNSDLWGTVRNIINWILAILGIVTVIMIIIGGINYTISQGDPGKTKKAKDTILYGIIGLVVALLAFAIVNFVLANIFNNTSTDATQQTSQEKK